MKEVKNLVVCKSDEEVLRMAEQILKSICNDGPIDCTHIQIVDENGTPSTLLNRSGFYGSIADKADIISCMVI